MRLYHKLYSQQPLKIYCKPLLEIYLFGSKKNINYQIKFILNLTQPILGKCPFRELPVRGTVLRGIVRWVNVFGELSVREKSLREMSVGEMSVREMSGYTFSNLQKLVLGNIFNAQLIRQPCRLSRIYFIGCLLQINSQFRVAIKDREKYSSKLGKILQGQGQEDHSEVKLRSEACHLDFQNIFQNRLC